MALDILAVQMSTMNNCTNVMYIRIMINDV